MVKILLSNQNIGEENFSEETRSQNVLQNFIGTAPSINYILMWSVFQFFFNSVSVQYFNWWNHKISVTSVVFQGSPTSSDSLDYNVFFHQSLALYVQSMFSEHDPRLFIRDDLHSRPTVLQYTPS